MLASSTFVNVPPGPPDARQGRQLKQRLDAVADPARPLDKRVEELHALCAAVGSGADAIEFREAGGITALVQMATEGFPADGDVAGSNSPWDAVTHCSPTMHHSLRRVAMGFLAVLSN
jgi:hypothetical protein